MNFAGFVGIFVRVAAVAIFLFLIGAATGATAQGGFTDPNIGGTVNDVDLQPDGKIIVGGSFATAGGQPRSRVARLNTDGTLDASFQDPQVVGSDSFNNHVFSIAAQPDGKVIIGGLFVSVG